MDEMLHQRPMILIADDSLFNRALLADMLNDEYTIVQAQDGLEALDRIKEYGTKLALV